MDYKDKGHWEIDFRKRLDEYRTSDAQGFPISIKIGVYSGCFHNEHSPNAYQEIYDYMEKHQFDCGYEEHESGPEVLAWIALGTAGLTLSKSVVDFVIAIINARTNGRKKGDRSDGNIKLIVRRYGNKGNIKEETILEISDTNTITNDIVEKAILTALKKDYNNK
ncbi:MAG: hypothetical protein QM657_03250 [Lacrimispora sp.]|uniref:hypothetical protein n=1 Tax=Lacrimispora sp. TaxID=2719234 RepID=UPI0039E2A30C